MPCDYGVLAWLCAHACLHACADQWVLEEMLVQKDVMRANVYSHRKGPDGRYALVGQHAAQAQSACLQYRHSVQADSTGTQHRHTVHA